MVPAVCHHGVTKGAECGVLLEFLTHFVEESERRPRESVEVGKLTLTVPLSEQGIRHHIETSGPIFHSKIISKELTDPLVLRDR